MNQDEEGFTFVSVAVVVAIAGVIGLGAVMTTGQIIKSSRDSSNIIMAIRQSQTLGYWVSRDALAAQTINSGDDLLTLGDVEFITVRWKDWETGDTYDIRYLWYDSLDSLKKITRKQVLSDKDGNLLSSKITQVSDLIQSATFITEGTNIWKLSVETHSGDKIATRDYQIRQRLQLS